MPAKEKQAILYVSELRGQRMALLRIIIRLDILRDMPDPVVFQQAWRAPVMISGNPRMLN